MKALVIDCAVSRLCIAAKKESCTVKICLDIGTKQSEKILSAIDFVLKELDLTPADLDYTAVTIGPGTFTGLRLGLSALKALTLANGTPLYGIPSLKAYSWPYKTAIETVLPVIEEKEDQYFYSFYARGEELIEQSDGSIEEILKQIDAENSVLACGPGAKDFVERVNETTPLFSVHAFIPQNDACESLFEIAEQMIKDKIRPLQDYDGPLYVRKSEAEIVLEKKNSENKA